MAEIHDAKSRTSPRGAVKEFKAYLNGLPGEKHRHFRFHQRKRGDGCSGKRRVRNPRQAARWRKPDLPDGVSPDGGRKPAESPQEGAAAPFVALRAAGLVGGKTLALARSKRSGRTPTDPDRAAMDEEMAQRARNAELADSIKANVRQARGLLDIAKADYDELQASGGVRAETVAVNLCKAFERLNEAVEYLASIERHEV